MNISFNSLYIRSFQSIGCATILLDSRGVVKVEGINDYEEAVNSNGAGKSSIFSSLFWCFYGKTPSGVSDPSNRYSSEPLCVKVNFTVDGSAYEIERSIVKSSHRLRITKDEIDISCRNRSDTDKMIRDSILCMSADIFQSIIYLSQGFGSRLSLLTPSARKDRLETITNTSSIISSFADAFQNHYSSLSNVKYSIDMENSRRDGSLNSLFSMLSEYEYKLKTYQSIQRSYDYEGKSYTADDLDNLRSSQSELNSARSDTLNKLNDLCKIRNDLTIDYNKLDNDIKSNTRMIADYDTKLRCVDTGNCPTCNQPLPDTMSEELRKETIVAIEQLSLRCNQLDVDKSNINSQIQKYNSMIASLQADDEELKRQLSRIQHIISNIPVVKLIDVDSIKASIEDCKHQVDKLSSDRSEGLLEAEKLSHRLDVVTHCRQLVTKQFRSYLLENTVSYLNSRLSLYSRVLYSNDEDVVRLNSESQKLDILLGNAPYETLSGGEQRRVDIAIMLAQRDLSKEIAGISCNIIILDEILESLDEQATQITLSLLEDQAKNVDSMFIISHNNYSLPVDSTITVVKGKDRIASIRES